MKAAPFAYVRAESLSHALQELHGAGADAKLLAGGQSLVPMMAMRLARPALLVDIARLAELQGIAADDRRVAIGAAVRQAVLEKDAVVATALPLVRQALRWVGHEQTRNRGTVGGSIVHADPSAELPLAACVLGAGIVLRSQEGGERRVPAREFFLGPMFTAASATECLVRIEWPVWPGGRIGSAFDEVAIRSGDFAIASAAAQVQLDAGGAFARAEVGAGGVDGTPLAFPQICSRLLGNKPSESLLRSVAADAAKACDPGSDIHADAGYRRHLVEVLVRRTLSAAVHAAGGAVA